MSNINVDFQSSQSLMNIKRNIEIQLFSFYFPKVLVQRDIVRTNRVLRNHFAKSMSTISEYICNSLNFETKMHKTIMYFSLSAKTDIF